MERVAATTKPTSHDRLTDPILDAVLAIVALEGFEGATICRVAAQAGCSPGAVQKRFPTRSQLLLAAFEHVVTTALQRIQVTTDDTGRDTLIARQRQAALHTLPLDAQRRIESLVWTSYLLRAAVDESLSDLPRLLDRAVHDALAGDLAAAQDKGTLSPRSNPAVLADALLALVDGTAIRMLYTPQDEHDALLDALDAGLNALLPN